MKRSLRKRLAGGTFGDVGVARSKTMSSIKSENNKTTEYLVRMSLVRAGLRNWTVRLTGLVGKPDFFFLRARLAIFVDGCFWHLCPKCGHYPKKRSAFWRAKLRDNKRRDKEITELLTSRGIKVLRFWEHDLKTAEGRRKTLETIKKAISKSGHWQTDGVPSRVVQSA